MYFHNTHTRTVPARCRSGFNTHAHHSESGFNSHYSIGGGLNTHEPYLGAQVLLHAGGDPVLALHQGGRAVSVIVMLL
jgi:hypothetical protein